MAVYAVWNNKGRVGKSYLTFQIASEYARTHLSAGYHVVMDKEVVVNQTQLDNQQPNVKALVAAIE